MCERVVSLLCWCRVLKEVNLTDVPVFDDKRLLQEAFGVVQTGRVLPGGRPVLRLIWIAVPPMRSW